MKVDVKWFYGMASSGNVGVLLKTDIMSFTKKAPRVRGVFCSKGLFIILQVYKKCARNKRIKLYVMLINYDDHVTSTFLEYTLWQGRGC